MLYWNERVRSGNTSSGPPVSAPRPCRRNGRLSGIFSPSKIARYHVRITNVVLDNIKSYRHASIPLGLGTVAVRGHNGAGKSTLVEAIGYALFRSEERRVG